MNLSCPIPAGDGGRILQAHGSGGLLTDQLVRNIFLSAFGTDGIPHDSAFLHDISGSVVVTTDAHVVEPLFFPGGDIGTLAVNGTVNDLLMAGAKPVALTASFMLGEGLALKTLQRVVDSMQQAAEAAGVRIVAGDTKVIPSIAGETETLYISTTGIGVQMSQQAVKPERIAPGDAVILTGDIGRHGVAVMAARHGLQMPEHIQSDCTALLKPMMALFENGMDVHCARDATRGGVGGVLHELAEARGCTVRVREADMPVLPAISAACGVLGLDPLFLANEGCAVLFIAEADVPHVLETLRHYPETAQAVCIGHVLSGAARVVCATTLGTERILLPPAGELLPRIC